MKELMQYLPTSVIVILTFIIVFVGIGVLVALGFFIRFIVTRTESFKAGSIEIGLNKIPHKEAEKIKEVTGVDVNDNSFTSIVVNILSYSTETAYESSAARQRLYDLQVKNSRSKMSMLKTIIIGEYIKKSGRNDVDFLDMVLSSLIDSVVITKLESAFQADRFSEKTKDAVLDMYNPFIETAFSDLKIELIKVMASTGDLFDKYIIDCLESQKDLLRKSIIECFEFAYNESLAYVKSLNEINLKYSALINNTLKSYFMSSNPKLVESLPEIWNKTMPPNSVVGDHND